MNGKEVFAHPRPSCVNHLSGSESCEQQELAADAVRWGTSVEEVVPPLIREVNHRFSFHSLGSKLGGIRFKPSLTNAKVEKRFDGPQVGCLGGIRKPIGQGLKPKVYIDPCDVLRLTGGAGKAAESSEDLLVFFLCLGGQVSVQE